MEAITPRAGADSARLQAHHRRPAERLSLVASLCLGLVIAATPAWAGPARDAAGGGPCGDFDQGHEAWSAVLAAYIKGGAVDYAGLGRSGRPALERYLRSLEAVCRASYDAWTREQRLAFWINAYNAYTVKLILEHYPLKSIRAIGILPGAAFRERFIPLRWLAGQELSLNDIENDILRKEFREPRIHFAIVCASKSCPELRPEAYRASTLDEQLTQAGRGFVADRTKNRFDAATRTLHLSSIFDWFRQDFEGASGTVPAFVARYAAPETAAALSSGGAVRVEFLTYDWSLNGR